MRRAFGGLLRDLKLAGRRLLSTPLFLLFAVGSIAIGIATTTAAYSILYALLWKPIGIPRSENVVVVASNPVPSASVNWRGALTVADFEAMADSPRNIVDVSASMSVGATLVTPSSSQLASFEMVSGRFFRAVQVEAARGRVIQPDDDAVRAQVLVLTDRAWRTRFASDPAVVGQVVKISGQPFEIVGVAPPSFDGLLNRIVPGAGWIPLSTYSTVFPATAQGGLAGSPQRRRVAVIGRIAPGQSLISSSSEIAAISSRLDADVPPPAIVVGPNKTPLRIPRGWTLRAIDTADNNANERIMGTLLITMVGLVLVVACTNLGNLTLSRGAYRQHELAVRRALGASRWRLVRELFAETILIGALASLCTLLLTRVLLLLATQEFSTPVGTFSFAPQLNLPAIVVSASALAISMLVFGLEPAFALTRQRAAMSLADGVSTFGAGRSTRQRAFIRWQVAISVCFFLIAATLTKGIVKLALHDPGVDVNELAMASIGATTQQDISEIRRTAERAAEVARRRADLTSVTVTTGLPFGSPSGQYAAIAIPGGPPVNGPLPMTTMIAASPEFFRTLGIPIVSGRQFDDRDLTASSHVVVLSEWSATQLFGSNNAAIGRSLLLQQGRSSNSAPFTVIGVARQTDVGRLAGPLDHLVYVPITEATGRYFALVARTVGSPSGAARVLQEAWRVADPDIGSGASGPAMWIVAIPLVIGRFAIGLAGGLGLLTLILSMIGLYGVQAQAVVFRTREMGLRMALGAAARQIRAMVLRQGARPVLEGMILGLFFGAVTRGIIRYTVSDLSIDIIDPVVFSAVPVPFMIAALIACYMPARRASRVEPNIALRHS